MITATHIDIELALRRKRRAAAASAPPATVGAWAAKHRRIDDQPFTLDRHQPLAAIYADNHPDIVVIKPAQRGVSEWAINLACYALDVGAQTWATDKAGINVGYLFPAQAALRDFAKERLSGLTEETPHLQAMFGGAAQYDDLGFKQVRQSYLYLRGTWSANGLKSFPADVLIYDEFDEMDPANVALAQRRLNASTVRRRVRLSTPTLPGMGIHDAYLQSDQRVWHVTCPTCDDAYALDFLRDVQLDGVPSALPGDAAADVGWLTWPKEQILAAAAQIACPGCGEALDHCGPGEWIAQAPHITHTRGYHVPWYGFPVVDLNAIAAALASSDPTEVTEGWRSDLGWPYTPKGAQLSTDQVRALAVPPPSTQTALGRVSMGVDVGKVFHYRISADVPGGRQVVALGSVPSWAGLSELIAKYRVTRCVVDALPESHAVAAWANQHKGVVYRALYPQDTALEGQLYIADKAKAMVKIHRSRAMDALYAAIVRGEERWSAPLTHHTEALAHLCAPTRVTTVDGRGQEHVTWVHVKADHLFHASVYDRIAHELLGRVGVYL